MGDPFQSPLGRRSDLIVQRHLHDAGAGRLHGRTWHVVLTRQGIFGEIAAGIVPHNTDNNLIQNCESGLPAYKGCRDGPEIGTTTVLTLCYKDLVAVGEQMSRDVERQRHVEGRERCRFL